MAGESPTAGSTTAAGPAWFDAEHFNVADFDAEKYVSDLRRFVPLDGLSGQLDAHLALLRRKLVEVINENYNEFVGLGSQLSSVEGAVMRIRKPIQELKGRVNDVRSKIDGELSALHAALERRKQIGAAREKLELMQDAVQLEGKVGKLIVEVKEMSSGAQALDLGNRSSLLERVAGEISKLDLLMAKGKDLPFIKGAKQRMTASRDELRKHLSSSLTLAITEKNELASFHLLHAFSLAGDLRAGETVVRSCIVKPLVEEAIAAAKGKPQLAGIVKALLLNLKTQCNWLFAHVYSSDSGLQGFNFLGNAVVAELHSQLAEGLLSIFSPGVPETFHRNYQALMSLLEELEGYCKTTRDIEAFRSSEAVQAFVKRFNLQVYFTLRFQELAGAADKAFQEGSFEILADEGLYCGALVAWWKSVHLCLADDVFLVPLADSFVRLLLQLISRLSSWVAKGVVADSKETCPSTFPVNSEDQLVLLSDLAALKSRLETATADRLRVLISGSTSDTNLCDQIIQSLCDAAAALLTYQDKMLGGVVDTVSASCADVLKKCVGATVGTMFRAGNQGPPTLPSEYVKRILEPLLNLLDNPKLRSTPDSVRKKLALEVADRTCARYEGSLHELLTILQKSRMSLKRIKSRASEPTDSGDSTNKSDLDNVLQQHFLDVQEMGKILMKIGINVKDLWSFRKLWELVAPQDQKEVTI